MAGVSNYLINKEVDWELRGQTFTPPTTTYVGLLLTSNGALARSTAYTTGQTVSMVGADARNHLYSCTTAGTTAASAPAYPGKTAEVITDGTAVFTEQGDVLAANGASFVEVSGGSYARVSVASSLANWSGTQGAGTTAASSGTSAAISNNAAVTYPTPTGNWQTAPQTIWGFFLADAATAGNTLRFGGLGADQTVSTGNAVSFAAGALTIKTDVR